MTGETRYSCRRLAKRHGPAILSLLTIALGVGVATVSRLYSPFLREVLLVTAIVAVGACCVPVRRALKGDVIQALRTD